MAMLRLAVLSTALAIGTTTAFALSEIKREEIPPPDGTTTQQTAPQGTDPTPGGAEPTSPQPDGAGEPAEPAVPDETVPEDSAPEETVPAEPMAPDEPGMPDQTGEPDDTEVPAESGRPHVDPDAPLPEIVYDLERLPHPAKRMRELIIEACKGGDIEQLRLLIGKGDSATQLALGGIEGDPIAYLKELSGDKEGQEILAILEEVLSAGYVHLDVGTPAELYVWPYFFAIPLDRLDAKQRVELFKIVTAGDYEDMKTFGSYIFYRVGITPEGRWSFFVAGD
jgi:hypothetical protein